MEMHKIIDRLPYSKPFLFVDEITEVGEHGIIGSYTFDANADFYKGHFKNNPITPGVILNEVMAQIGLVCLGIYLLDDQFNPNIKIALTSISSEFLKSVYPNEKVTVTSTKIYFRFGKLKCNVTMENEQGDEVCTAIIAGIIR